MIIICKIDVRARATNRTNKAKINKTQHKNPHCEHIEHVPKSDIIFLVAEPLVLWRSAEQEWRRVDVDVAVATLAMIELSEQWTVNTYRPHVSFFVCVCVCFAIAVMMKKLLRSVACVWFLMALYRFQQIHTDNIYEINFYACLLSLLHALPPSDG